MIDRKIYAFLLATAVLTVGPACTDRTISADNFIVTLNAATPRSFTIRGYNEGGTTDGLRLMTQLCGIKDRPRYIGDLRVDVSARNVNCERRLRKAITS